MKLIGEAYIQGVEAYSFAEKDDGGKETGRTVKGRWVRLFEKDSTESYLFTLPDEVVHVPDFLTPVHVVFEYRKFGDKTSMRVVSLEPARVPRTAPAGAPSAAGVAG